MIRQLDHRSRTARETVVVIAGLVFRDPGEATCRAEQTLEGGVINPLAFPDRAVSVSRLL